MDRVNRGVPRRGNVERPVPSQSPPQRNAPNKRENAHRDAHSTASPGNANALRKTREQTRTNGRLFLSPPPLRALISSAKSTFTQSSFRARTYARLSWFSFFAFTSSPALYKSLLISALRVKTLSFSSSHRSSPSDRIINNSKQSLFQQNKTRQLPFPLRYIGGEGKIPKPSHLTSYCTKIYRHPVKE